MPYAPIIAPTTALEAVNTMLASGGEAPVSTIVGQRPDVQSANGFLKDSVREVLAEGWTFNTDHGYEIAPTGTMTWTDSRTNATTLNVFLPPAGLLSFETTNARWQQGSQNLDTVIRPSRLYNGGGTKVFYDRVMNRDGFCRSYLYIDPVWLLDFEDLPQEARTVITHRAVQRYLRNVVGDAQLAATYGRDESVAMRSLKRNHGRRDEYNVFNNAALRGAHGGRPLGMSGVVDGRSSPGPA